LPKGSGQTSAVDAFIMLTLLQLKLRPDIATPQSYLQIMTLNKNSQSQYFEFSPNTTVTGFSNVFSGLQSLAHRYNSSSRLIDIKKKLHAHTGFNYYAAPELSNFLMLHHSTIEQIPILQKHYMKGDQVLSKNESFQPPFLPLSSFQYSHKAKSLEGQLYPYGLNKQTIQCTFNAKKYDRSIYKIISKTIGSHVFGLHYKGETFSSKAPWKYRFF
jgi:hypothetical protein